MKPKNLLRLRGALQPYAWGGHEYLPRLLALDAPSPTPAAEYWLSAHGGAHAQIEVDGEWGPLAAWQEAQGVSLPFLFKVLDVAEMLSIQVHPNGDQAIAGFDREEAAGIPVSAPRRNFKDRNPKPEMMVALSDFWLLHGFRTADLLRKALQERVELQPLLPLFAGDDYLSLYSGVMCKPQAEVDRLLQPLVARLLPLYRSGALEKSSPDFWAARAAETFCANGEMDRGIFSIYLLNLVHLRRGEGIFQGANLPHAYLEGQNLEIMTPSDNVLRGGLTPKHIDVEALLSHVQYGPTVPQPMAGEEWDGIVEYIHPQAPFGLTLWSLAPKVEGFLTAQNAEVLFALKGDHRVQDGRQWQTLSQGAAVLLVPGGQCHIAPVDGGTIVRAFGIA